MDVSYINSILYSKLLSAFMVMGMGRGMGKRK